MKRILFLLASFVLGLLASRTPLAAATAPGWDLDYQVWVGVPGWDYQLWIDPPDGRPWVYGTYDTQAEANNDWFFLVEHNVIPAGSSVWTQPVAVTEWEYWDSYETWSQANDSASDWAALGFQTSIVAVYGGPLPQVTPLIPGIAPRGFASDLHFWRWLDGD